MRYVRLPGGAEASVLGFGGAALLGRAGRQESLHALSLAWDSGVTFYDTARSYGYGGSESLLGEFLGSGRRQQAVICTKFGIAPSQQQKWKQALKPAVRLAVKVMPGLRTAVRSVAADQFVAGQFSVEALRQSFETSLKELRSDYVDLLVMHAAPMGVLAQDDLLEAMENLVTQGKVRMAGISANQDVIAETFLRAPRALTTAQFAVNIHNMEFTELTQRQHGWFLVANHPFGGPLGVKDCRSSLEAMRTQETLPAGLREKLAAEDKGLMAEIVLNAILSDTGIHAVIPAMIQPGHIQLNIRAIEQCRFSGPELKIIREELTRRLTALSPTAI